MLDIIISKTFTFEASHILPRHPGKCSRLHGHSWNLRVAVKGSVSEETGFVTDYGDLKALVREHIVDKVDHQHLGQGLATTQDTTFAPPFGQGFYPSSENLVLAFVRILQPLVKELPGHPTLWEVSLDETCTSRATWAADRT